MESTVHNTEINTNFILWLIVFVYTKTKSEKNIISSYKENILSITIEERQKSSKTETRRKNINVFAER